MNDCPRAPQLCAYFDDELSAEAREDFQRHLLQCEACSLELARLERLSAQFREMPEPAVPRAMMQRLHRSVDRLGGRATIRLAEACAAVAALVLLVCMLSVSDPAAVPAPAGLSYMDALTQEPAAGPPVAASSDLLANWVVHDLSTGGEP